ncbi:hypothetical protein GCM10028803_46430 [Larkinella knui]|uniref:Uncharacterized protein n=1 Tax=Larkinella knui TaxID=2025310 RepID=A0A3P1CQ87_9BACT|nr:hypothetical protein [Larkinella knui]RRB15236.1 hypothetical protein EHT87_11890 [Larkinella knui]
MEVYTKSFLHHEVLCELSVEVAENECRVLAFVNGIPVYDTKQVQPLELEGVLLTAEQITRQEAEKAQPVSDGVTSVVKMLLRLGYTKSV